MERQTVEHYDPACDECRNKKLKCSRSRPSCEFCLKHAKLCNYSTRRLRAPLTRAYVSSLEQRVKNLERMLLAHHADERDNASSLQPEALIDNPENGNKRRTTRQSTPDTLPADSSGFDWGTEDGGQARESSIPLSEEGTGYLGKFTNVALFRTLYQTCQLWNNAPTCQPRCPNHLRLAGEDGDAIPWKTLEAPDSDEGFSNFLIDAFFRQFHTTYPLLHEATFRAQYSEVVPRPPPKAWSLLIRTVFAIGAWCTGCRISTEDDADSSDCFQLFDKIDLFRSGSLCMVQALALLGCYLHKRCKSNTASVYLGAAVKMAMSLGLHREFPDWNISLFDREMRRRVWWCLYVLESGHSMAMGRPVLLPPVGIMDIRSPLNISEQAITARTTANPEEVSGLTIYSNLIAQVEFHLMANDTYNLFISNPDLPPKDLLAFNAKIDGWILSLPQYLQENSASVRSLPRLNFASHHLMWRVRCLKVIFFFPNFTRFAREKDPTQTLDNDRQEAVAICVGYAHNIITSIEEFFANQSSNPLRDWYARFCLIQSALVVTLTLQANFSFLKDTAAVLRSDFDKILILLAKVSDHDPFARTILDIMNRLSTSSDGRDLPLQPMGTPEWDDFLDLCALPFEQQPDSELWSM